jgi:methylglyoxal synthase
MSKTIYYIPIEPLEERYTQQWFDEFPKEFRKEGFNVEKLLSGPRGGDAQIAALLATGNVDIVIFFRDPLDKHPHEPDVQMLMRLCDVHNIPLATNPASGNYILKGIAESLKEKEG